MDDDIQQRLRVWSAGFTVIERLSGGHRNDVWLIEIDGVRYTVRRSRRLAKDLDWELDLLQYLASQDVGVPAVLAMPDGRRRNGDVVVLAFVEGRAPASEREWRRVADELTRIHRLTVDWLQRPTFKSTQDLLSECTGGDVDLTSMPDDVVARCRHAWRALGGESMSAIHGDPLGNVLITESGVAFIDWDEARVDASILDLADLPVVDFELEKMDRLAVARRAASAWEVANAWNLEPDYARRRLADLLN